MVCPIGQSKIVNITQKCDFTNECPKAKESWIALSSFCKSDQECYEGSTYGPNICQEKLDEFENDDEGFASAYCANSDSGVPSFPCMPSTGKNKFFQCLWGRDADRK